MPTLAETPVSSATPVVSAALALLWIAWLVIWFVAARWSAPKIEIHPSSSQRIYRVLQLVGGVLIAIGGPRLGRLLPVTLTVAYFALALVAAGLAYTVWARIHLGRNWSVDVSLKAGHRIIRSGPYGITRHPIYTGLLTAMLGTTIIRGTVLAAIGFVVLVTAIHLKLSQEEELLSRHFGDEYASYRRETRQLIPFIW